VRRLPDPSALGVSRVLTVDTSAGLEVGTFSFKSTLPLNDMEVVLTFDDGPLRGITEKVLAALRAQCAQATFFIVGQMAAAAPELVRAEAVDGHTIASHTYSHIQPISQVSLAKGISDIDAGFAAVAKALGTQPAPFFRFPGFAVTDPWRGASRPPASASSAPMPWVTTGTRSHPIRCGSTSSTSSHSIAAASSRCMISTPAQRQCCRSF
jgi:peptidoglycan/xylan/chitin deacetylase (PgdA/CDA1 family)